MRSSYHVRPPKHTPFPVLIFLSFFRRIGRKCTLFLEFHDTFSSLLLSLLPLVSLSNRSKLSSYKSYEKRKKKNCLNNRANLSFTSVNNHANGSFVGMPALDVLNKLKFYPYNSFLWLT